MTRPAAVALASLALVAPALAQEAVTEARSAVSFPAKVGDMSILGVGLRTKTMLKVKVYAIGLYVADTALAGPLHSYKGKTSSPEFYKDLRGGDFEKQVTMTFTRDLSTSQLQGAFREVLETADQKMVTLFVGFFGNVKSGQQAIIHWKDGKLEVQVAGLGKPPISDKNFAQAVFSIWLGDKPIQDDIKRDVVSRADGLIK